MFGTSTAYTAIRGAVTVLATQASSSQIGDEKSTQWCELAETFCSEVSRANIRTTL